MGNMSLAHVQKIREPSEPSYTDGAILRVPTKHATGKVVDHWTEDGPIHYYTLRLGGLRFIDVIEDEVELVEPAPN